MDSNSLSLKFSTSTRCIREKHVNQAETAPIPFSASVPKSSGWRSRWTHHYPNPNQSGAVQQTLRIFATYTHKTYMSTTAQCAATTRHPAAQALRQPRRAPRVLVSRPQRLYIDYAVRCRNIVFWAYDYLDYLPRLVSTRKLVEDGSREINS
jgi:hypothetical protein